MPSPSDDWWRSAVIYQIYPRSFADSDGDGMGDLPGITARLTDLRDLGVDAVWLSPFYPSPQHDAGYDVADYRAVDPRFGDLGDADKMIAEAQRARPARSSSTWCPTTRPASTPGSGPRWPPRRAARSASATSSATAAAPTAASRRTRWQSVFGGPAWERLADGQWYLHLFDVSQPDLNWGNPEVRAEFVVDPAVLARPGRRRLPGRRRARPDQGRRRSPTGSTPGEILGGMSPRGRPAAADVGPGRRTRDLPAVARGAERVRGRPHPGRRGLGAAGRPAGPLRAPRRDAPGVQLRIPGHAVVAPTRCARSSTRTTAANAAVGAPDHLGALQPRRGAARDPAGLSGRRAPPARHRRRRPAAGRRAGAAPGPGGHRCRCWRCPARPTSTRARSWGCPRHTEIPDEFRQDPAWERSGHTERGRDGCRVPIPWEADAPSYGFGPADASWLPQPAVWAEYALDRQRGVAGLDVRALPLGACACGPGTSSAPAS